MVTTADDGKRQPVRDLLSRSNLTINDFELMEVNEAFAAQYLACERKLGLDRETTNVNGSAIGLGHPVGPRAVGSWLP
jgi:acetyl-CoA C-acetyltransferase